VGSIEYATWRADQPIYEPGPAAERVCAGGRVAALSWAFRSRSLRARKYLHGAAILRATIGPASAYQEAGACSLPPAPHTNSNDIAALVSSVVSPG